MASLPVTGISLPAYFGLPQFEMKSAVAVDQLKIGAVGSDQPSSVRPRRERDEHIKMQVAQLVRREPFIRVNFSQYLARFQPILFRGGQDGMIPLQRPQEFPLRWLRGAAPQLRKDDGRCPDQTGHRFDSLLMAAGAEMIDENRRVEDDEVTHRDPRRRVFPRASASSS